MLFIDDRTIEQKKTHPYIVLATDKFMSGWGQARNGSSYAGWACRHEDLPKVERWVSARGEMVRVRIVLGNYRPRAMNGHCHIYVVNENHPALR